MRSVILMFVGGLLGGLVGPVTALVGVAAGYAIGCGLVYTSAPEPDEKQSPCG